ncbi:HNH endonuclease [Acidobacteria bacterium AH-259-A15]|nr:HNH endonuclease [Acidobacteria bacterium AH-259-A15]
MPWKIPAHPHAWHPNRKFAFGRKALFRFHVVLGTSPREISELHKKLFGLTISPQGVAGYLRAYDFYKPQKPGMYRFRKIRKLGGNGSLYWYDPKHPRANKLGRVLLSRLVAEKKYGLKLDPNEWRIIFKDGNRLNCLPENILIKPTQKGRAVQLLRKAKKRQLKEEEIRYVKKMARREKLSVAAMIYRIQLKLRSKCPDVSEVGALELVKLLEEKFPWFTGKHRTLDGLFWMLAKALRVSPKNFRSFRLRLDREIPVVHQKALERHGWLPLKRIRGEPVPDEYLR